VNIFISSLKIYSRILSVTFSISFDDAESLQSLIRKPLRFTIYTGASPEPADNGSTNGVATREIVWFRGKIVSVGKNYFVVHTGINLAVLSRLVKARRTSLRIRIDRDRNDRGYVRENRQVPTVSSENGNAESKGIESKSAESTDIGSSEEGSYSLALLKTILHSASQKLGIQEEELIYKLTTYTKNGKTYEGKRNLDEVSEKQKVIIYDKVKKLLREKDISKNVPFVRKFKETKEGKTIPS